MKRREIYDIMMTTFDKMTKEIIDGQERYVYQQIMKVSDIQIDYDELTRALAYDRGQYEAGYRAGFNDAHEVLVRPCTNCFIKPLCKYFNPDSKICEYSIIERIYPPFESQRRKRVKYAGPPVDIKVENDNTGYDAVENIIEDWYNANNYGTALSFLISIQFDDDDDIDTIYVEREEDGSYIWEYDWWEGQQDFKLLGFCPVAYPYLKIEGFPPIEE